MPLRSNNLNSIYVRSSQGHKRFFKNLGLFSPSFKYLVSYSLWIAAIRLLTLTLITYFIISPTTHFQDISDAFSSNEVSLMGLSSFLYVVLIQSFSPMAVTPWSEWFSKERLEKSFLPGFVEGTFFAGALVLALALSGAYRYWGYFIQFDEAPLELLNVFLRMVTLAALAYCEEFIFRFKMTQALKGLMSQGMMIHLIAIFYCAIKLLQFDLGTLHLISLYLGSVALSYRAQREGHFARGAGFWAAILILFHPVLSLPIFGNDFSGIFLIKYQSNFNTIANGGGLMNHASNQFLSTAALAQPATHLSRMLSGGAGGPFSSVAFQILLLLDIGRSILRQKKLS